MEGGMFVSKQIHLDEQACSGHLSIVQPFPHGVCTRATWSLAVR
jgi:acyl dehydratase